MQEKESEILLEIFNKIFEIFDNNPLKDLSNLSDEFLIRHLLIEIEPEFEKITSKLDILEDKNFSIRYSNMVRIVNNIETFLEINYEKSKIISRVPIKKLIIINDYLKAEDYQIITIMEILLLISALSSKKDLILDKIGECDEKIINSYLSYVEKYIPLETRNDCNESLININSSILNKYNYNNNSSNNINNLENGSRILGVLNEKLNKKIEDYEKEKNNLLKNINGLEIVISEERKKKESLETKITELENRLKDNLSELEVNKTNKNINKLQQEYIEESLLASQYKTELKNKELEIEDKNLEINYLKKTHIDDMKEMQKNIDGMQELVIKAKNEKIENEKLKNKVKELQIYKDKVNDYDELVITLESKNRMIDNLIADKNSLNSQVEKLTKDFLNEKDKNRKKEFEFKQMQIDLNEITKENNKLENLLKLKGNHITNNNNNNNLNNNNNNNNNKNNNSNSSGKIPQVSLNLGELDNSLLGDNSIYLNENNNNNKNIQLLEKEILDIKADKNDILSKYKKGMEEQLRLNDENESLKIKLEEKLKEIKSIKVDKEKKDIEKQRNNLKEEKFIIELEKKTVAIQKLEVENRKLETEAKDYKDKVNKVQSDKQNLIKEYEKLIEKVNKEKVNLSLEINTLNKEIEKIKLQHDNQCKNIFINMVK